MTLKGSQLLDDLSFAPAWFAQAACTFADRDQFFPERGDSPKAAKKLCADCPVAEECLQYAVDERIHEGIWGGKTASQRRKDRRAAPRTGRRPRDYCMKGLHPMSGSNVLLIADGARICAACQRARLQERDARRALAAKGGTP